MPVDSPSTAFCKESTPGAFHTKNSNTQAKKYLRLKDQNRTQEIRGEGHKCKRDGWWRKKEIKTEKIEI
jgi:hypothetical protein